MHMNTHRPVEDEDEEYSPEERSSGRKTSKKTKEPKTKR
jgi:hypothetical protein